MAQMIFVNLPVKDLNKSIAFFTNLGYTFNPQFTDEKATCMIISDTIFVMLVTEAYFQTFTTKPVGDGSKSTEVIMALSTDSRAAVDDIIKKATDGGATIPKAPQDLGFMYSQAFHDLDGHLWEYLYMDMSAFPQN